MRFIDRVKKILLEKNRAELSNIEEEIKEINTSFLEEHQNVTSLKEEVDELHQEKVETQKNILSQKQLRDLQYIYDFIANYPRIEQIVENIREMPQIYKDSPIYDDLYSDEMMYQEELSKRNQLCSILKYLNEQIIYIQNADIKELQKDTSKQIESNNQKKGNLFSKIFTKKEKKRDKPKKENNIFDKYRETINDFVLNYNRFLLMNPDENFIVSKRNAELVLHNIRNLLSIKKQGIKLEESDKIYLKACEPFELWKEILKYYSNTSTILNIVQNFERNIDKYELMYKEQPDLFKLENLEKIFKENNQVIADIRTQQKDMKSKQKVYKDKKQSEIEMKSQLRDLNRKKQVLISKIKKIETAEKLSELGYKDKFDAAKKLSIETKDYVVIPIPNDVENISSLFNEEKQIDIQIDGKKFFTTYSNDIAKGKINSIENQDNSNGALMVPIDSLRNEDIDNIRSGKISVNKSILQSEKLLAILPIGRTIDFEGYKIELKNYAHDDISEQVKKFLGEDYSTDEKEIENYEIFKVYPNISAKEKKLKNEAITRCLFENVKRIISYKDLILVNGKSFFLNQEDERKMLLMKKTEPLNIDLLERIANDIETYLIEDGTTGIKIDKFYQTLLLEYIRVHKKAKADYQDEPYTTIQVGNKKLSIKPPLPAKNEMIAKKYSRSKENIVYKTMKLANLVNQFAHLADNKNIQEKLYNIKLDLIEQVIDLSKNNPNIQLKNKFDENKKVMSVILEIPGYSMIALHTMNRSRSLMHKSNNLEEYKNDVLKTMPISIFGVNTELIKALKKMSVEQRMRTLLDLDSNTFCKLAIKMGYNSENILSENDKKEFINDMISDNKLNALLEEAYKDKGEEENIYRR